MQTSNTTTQDSIDNRDSGIDTQNRIVKIPSLLTTSLRAILDAFGADIVELRANGSVTTTNQTLIDDLREYGVIREQQTNHRIEIDYTQLQDNDSNEVSNPLDEEAQQQLKEHISAILDAESRAVEPDLTVTSVTIRISDERLQEVTPAQTSEFDLHFSADPAEENVRDQTRRRNSDRGLYSELGFRIQNLNLRSVVETTTIYTEQTDGQYFSWQGPEDIRPRSPNKLAVRINQILPEPYAKLKNYQVADDQKLDLLDDTDDQEAENTTSEGENN
jgi:hypothetical protein